MNRAIELRTEGGMRSEGLKPLISVLTFTRNAAATLSKTIDSVAKQTIYSNVEYIIVDGGSTDGSVDILRKNDRQINKWISEPDRGIVDAQNKAIKLATADYIFCLNADDWIDESFLELAIDKIRKTNADIVYGDVIVYSEDDKALYRLKGECEFFSRPSSYYQMPGVNFPTMVIRRSLFGEVGFFDESFRVAPDYEWLLRAKRTNQALIAVYCPEVVTHFRLGGNSDLRYFEGLLDAQRASIMHGGSRILANYYLSKRIFMHYLKIGLMSIFPKSLHSKMLDFGRKF